MHIQKIRNTSGRTSLKRIVASILFLFIFQTISFKVSATCTGTPSYTVDLSGHPDTTWVSPSVGRSGTCCSSSNCIHFRLTLDSNAAGIIFSVSGGTGATSYFINCSTTGSAGSPFCLRGTGPWDIDFCKPGSNLLIYTIQSVPKPYLPHKTLYISTKCKADLVVKGLTKSTITWSSISGAGYDSNLSCKSGCDTSKVSTGNNFPSYVDYKVCGTPILPCYGSFCDTIRVYYVNPLSVVINSNPAAICSGDSLKLTAIVSGGKSPYQYSWNTGASSNSIYVKIGGLYTVTVTDSMNCKSSSDSVTLVVNALPSPLISGDLSPCELTKGNIYSTSNYAGHTYAWAVLNGSIATGQSTNALSINWNGSGTGSMALVETNTLTGCSKSATFNVTIYKKPGPKPIYHK